MSSARVIDTFLFFFSPSPISILIGERPTTFDDNIISFLSKATNKASRIDNIIISFLLVFFWDRIRDGNGRIIGRLIMHVLTIFEIIVSCIANTERSIIARIKWFLQSLIFLIASKVSHK